jgi:hypothetical protein
MFTARYALSPYIKEMRLVFKGLMGRVALKFKAIETRSWDVFLCIVNTMLRVGLKFLSALILPTLRSQSGLSSYFLMSRHK